MKNKKDIQFIENLCKEGIPQGTLYDWVIGQLPSSFKSLPPSYVRTNLRDGGIVSIHHHENLTII